MPVCMNIFISSMLIGMLVVIVGASMLPPLNEVQALMAFKAGISKDPFGWLESWHGNMANASSPCKEGKGGAAWAGIVCDSRTRHVITLNLSSFNLSGSISPSLAFLPALSRLDLSHNRLYGKLPNTLFNIPHSPLQYLNLSYNLLEGELPNSLANLSALLMLDLSDNYFVGKMPPSLGQLKNLQVLKLKDSGSLTGYIAKEIWQLPALRELWIIDRTYYKHGFLLNVTLPEHFGFCGTITRLHLEGLSATRGSAIPSSLGDCHKLEVLIIDHVEGLQGFIPPQIWQLPLLQSLAIASIFDESYGNSLSGLLPDSFAFCHTIVDLELWGINVTRSSIPSSLGVCHHLEVLVFFDVVGLEGFIPPQIWQLPPRIGCGRFRSHQFRQFAIQTSRITAIKS